MISRREVAEQLERWAARAVDAEAIRAWAEARLGEPAEDEAVREAVYDLDLLAVHLLTPIDVPELLALITEGGGEAALARWRNYRDTLDRDVRSRQLRRDPFYRPFCC